MAIMSIVYCNFGGRIAHSVVPSATPVKRDYIPDTLGSVSRVMGPGQTVISSFTYTPYGEISTSTGPRQNLEFVGTLGYYRDRFVASLTYVRARWYQASLARWLTVDPLWPILQAYLYSAGNPSSIADPTGYAPEKPQGSPVGIDNIKNCPEKLASDLTNARKFVCGQLDKIASGGGMAILGLLQCAWKKLPKDCQKVPLPVKFMRFFNCLRLWCSAGMNVECVGKGGKCGRGICAYSECRPALPNPFGTVYVCPEAWDCKANEVIGKNCATGGSHYGIPGFPPNGAPPSANMLLHEMLHYCGVCPDPKNNRCIEALTQAISSCIIGVRS